MWRSVLRRTTRSGPPSWSNFRCMVKFCRVVRIWPIYFKDIIMQILTTKIFAFFRWQRWQWNFRSIFVIWAPAFKRYITGFIQQPHWCCKYYKSYIRQIQYHSTGLWRDIVGLKRKSKKAVFPSKFNKKRKKGDKFGIKLFSILNCKYRFWNFRKKMMNFKNTAIYAISFWQFWITSLSGYIHFLYTHKVWRKLKDTFDTPSHPIPSHPIPSNSAFGLGL